jgi:hypothetical protein
MGVATYEVPLIRQGDNPICWVACMAMVASERQQCSVGIGSFTGGFDPDNSCMMNPAVSMNDAITRMYWCGFDSIQITATGAGIESALNSYGPLILSHNCLGFPYGSGWVLPTSGRHAIVITAIDTDMGWCWMNNPWGNKDRAVSISAMSNAIKQMQDATFAPIAYYMT